MKTHNLQKGTLLACLIAVVLGGLVRIAVGQNAITWDKVGTKTVDYTIDRDVIDLKDTPVAYNALKLKVDQGTINIHKATVHFANGETQDVNIPDVLTKDNDGQFIDLKGNQRKINKIVFWYDTKNSNKQKAIVEVWARK
jgi:hypothetical protein